MDIIDLHTHTTASDGNLTPSELISIANKTGIKAIAITDHDTINGIPEAIIAGINLNIEVISGIEISIQYNSYISLHLLGYFVNFLNSNLIQSLKKLEQIRNKRNDKIITKLNHLGIPLNIDEIKTYTTGNIINRSHIAKALIIRKIVQNYDEAFTYFLTTGAPAYVTKHRLTPEEGIRIIKNAGGLAILAHPGLLKISENEIEEIIIKLKLKGLAGIEVYYSNHNKYITKILKQIATRQNLLISGGTDFHGIIKPNIQLGRGIGNLKINYRLLIKIKQYKKNIIK